MKKTSDYIFWLFTRPRLRTTAVNTKVWESRWERKKYKIEELGIWIIIHRLNYRHKLGDHLSDDGRWPIAFWKFYKIFGEKCSENKRGNHRWNLQTSMKDGQFYYYLYFVFFFSFSPNIINHRRVFSVY